MVDDERLPVANSDKVEMKAVRFRTLGCYPLTGAVESTARSVEDIILELLTVRTSERCGRTIDRDTQSSMEEKKKEGYF
jgi:sulfate adenylyltransferase subunit 2